MDLLIENNLTILNGRTSGDLLGAFTYVNYCGASTIDYFAVSPSLLSLTNYLHVGHLNEYSDHKPLYTCFSLSRIHNTEEQSFSFKNAPMPYKWDRAQISDFVNAQNDPLILNKIGNIANSPIPSTPEDVLNLNNNIINLVQDIADKSLDKKKPPPAWHNKNKWFDHECRREKRSLNQAYRTYNQNTHNNSAKNMLFERKRSYKHTIKTKKRIYMKKINSEIQDGTSKNINWKSLKKMKNTASEDTKYDDHDLHNFYLFFKQLYHDYHPLKEDTCIRLQGQLSDLMSDSTHYINDHLLNDPFSKQELTTEIKKLNSGKSVSTDLVSNDMLKNLNQEVLQLILNLFNTCLCHGVYPWCSSTMTPIHKNGDKYNPDNYRAIALGSCMGKLFSNLLLERIQLFRSSNCPDPPNQLGFTRNSQTSDHILTLKTIIDKYTAKRGSKLYACFVDYKKAFDSVARDALLYKLAKQGIRGQIFSCLQYMYEHSHTQIKLLNKLSDNIDLKNGVEQGHPLSPELFKIFIFDLTEELNKVIGNFPMLVNSIINHLLWADDLVLLSLDESSLRNLLDILHKFCTAWGLQVNIKKTKVLTFNKAGKLLRPSTDFYIGDKTIDVTSSYCYLGIVFQPSGSFKMAINELRKKAIRATFSLKQIINNEHISPETLFKLFDALISPIISYASQVLFPSFHFSKAMISTATNNKHGVNWQQQWLTKIATDPFEKIHLKFIKWVLGQHKKSSNVGCWGDSGRKPLGCKMLKQTINYFNRLSKDSSPDSYVGLAYIEQAKNSLPWHSTLLSLIKAHGKEISTNNSQTYISPSSTYMSSVNMFDNIWKSALEKSPKLDFYKTIKSSPDKEEYLIVLPLDLRRQVTKLRISAHRLPIELGRYHTPQLPRHQRLCALCKHATPASPYTDDGPVGDELHLLFNCKVSCEYNHMLNKTNKQLWNKLDVKGLLTLKNRGDIFNFATYVKKCFKRYHQLEPNYKTM